MNLEEYRHKQFLYEKFSVVVKNILEKVICSEVHTDKYHLQQIQNRAKTYESLSKRLAEKSNQDSDSIEELRHDLAGCRIIFYYNSDVNRFLESRIIENNFKVDREKSKIHGQGLSPDSANDYYTANHFVVELSEDRLKLSEYAEFNNLKCEIQIHTVLNHAWSETAHDITYKKIDDSNFGQRIRDKIDTRLVKIMKDYLKPAGYEFQKIQIDSNNLLNGKKIFDRDIKAEIIDCNDNNKLYEILEGYENYVLPNLSSDYLDNELSLILEFLTIAIEKSNKIKPIEIDTPLGSFQGKTWKDILDICLLIINALRYVDRKSIFSWLVKLYITLDEDDAKKNVIESVEKIAGYNIDVLEKVGLQVQYEILDVLKILDSNYLSSIKEFIAIIGGNFLVSTAKGYSSDYESISFNSASIEIGEPFANLRKEMLNFLFEQYDINDAEDIKRLFISTFNKATSMPTRTNYSNELLGIILNNCLSIIEFYTNELTDEQYEILESIEADVCHLYHRALDIIDSNTDFDENCKKISKLIEQNAIEFRDKLNSNENYLIYKTLVGYEGIFPQSWVDYNWNFTTKKNEYRSKQAEQYLSSIKGNEEYWKTIITRCTKIESNDAATFPMFCKFLNNLAIKHPIYTLDLLKENEQAFIPFSNAIFSGLLKSKQRDIFLKQMNTWVDNNKYLVECVACFKSNEQFDKPLLLKVLKNACEDTATLTILVVVAITIFSDTRQDIIKLLFLPALEKLTSLKATDWVYETWFMKDQVNSIFAKLNSDERHKILSNLLCLERIDYKAEAILIPIANNFPKEVIEFFKQRIDTEKNQDDATNNYESIPFNFHQLGKSLSNHVDIILDSVSNWYNENYELFRFYGANLVSNIFSQYTFLLDFKLRILISNNIENNYNIVMAILHNYKGTLKINDICKYLVSSLPEDSELLDRVFSIFLSTGIVEGDFGLANKWNQTKNELSSWLEDPNLKVKNFAKKYTNILDQQIKQEQGKAEERLELRKRSDD